MQLLPFILGYVLALWADLKWQEWKQRRRYNKAFRDGVLMTSKELNENFTQVYEVLHVPSDIRTYTYTMKASDADEIKSY